MNPTLGSAKVDKILSQFSQMYRNSDYIAELILPPLKVKEKTGKFAKYGKENLRVYSNMIYRAPGTRAFGVDYSVSQGSYRTEERSVEKKVPDEMVNNTDDPYEPKRDATAVCMDVIWGNQELALATSLASTSIITQYSTLSGTSQWSDYANSDPIANIETAINTVRAATGKRPNTMVLSHAVFTKLKYHPDIREQLKYTNGGQLSDAQFIQGLKDFFMLKDVFIGSAIYDSATEGQTASLADIWGKHCWLFYKTERPTLMQATFGYTFFDVPREVDTYREESTRSDIVRQRYSYDMNLMDTALCYAIRDAIL